MGIFREFLVNYEKKLPYFLRIYSSLLHFQGNTVVLPQFNINFLGWGKFLVICEETTIRERVDLRDKTVRQSKLDRIVVHCGAIDQKSLNFRGSKKIKIIIIVFD